MEKLIGSTKFSYKIDNFSYDCNNCITCITLLKSMVILPYSLYNVVEIYGNIALQFIYGNGILPKLENKNFPIRKVIAWNSSMEW